MSLAAQLAAMSDRAAVEFIRARIEDLKQDIARLERVRRASPSGAGESPAPPKAQGRRRSGAISRRPT